MKATKQKSARPIRLADQTNLELHNVTSDLVTYRGKRALHLIEKHAEPDDDGDPIAILPGTDFENGTIEATLAGLPAKGAPEGARGFIGIAFRVSPNDERFECFYLRPTNGRADDQLRRNHATQYISHPDYPWYKLREENPGVYESYTDLVTGAWTKIKIVVAGVRAQLYVDDADQPCLIVNDLKLGATRGGIGLWIGQGTDAYFSSVTIHPS